MGKYILSFWVLFIGIGAMAQNYCIPHTMQCEWESTLSRFNSFGGIQDIQFTSSNCSPGGYSFESDDTIYIQRGSSIQFMAGGTGVIPFSIFTWIDFDQNGSFQEPGEMVYDQLNDSIFNGTEPHHYTVPIPSNAPLGTTRMRVLLHQNLGVNYMNRSPGSCVYIHVQRGVGQTRDFVVKIVDTTNCTQNPNTANIRAVEHYKCPNAPVTLYTRTGISPGATYQWLSSTNSSGPFMPDSGGTNPVHRVFPTTDTYYRLQITCGSQTFTTPTFQVVVRSEPLSGSYTINRQLGEGNRRFRSLRKFAQALNCNGVSGPVTATIDTNTGVYRGAVHFSGIQNPDSFPIVINGKGAVVRPFRATNVQNSSGSFNLTSKCMTFSNTHNITINELKLDVPEINSTENVFIQSNASKIHFSNVEMLNESGDDVVVLRNCSRISFDGCVFDSGKNGIFNSHLFNSINRIRIENSTFIDQTQRNINLDDFAHIRIKNNSFTRTSTSFTQSFASVLLNGSNIGINGNEFFNLTPINHNNDLSIIHLNSRNSDSITVTNNLIYNNHNRGTQAVFRLSSSPTASPHLLLGHNTVYFNRSGGDKSLKWWRGIEFDSAQFSSATIANNIWYISRETPNTQFYFGTFSSASPIVFEDNSYYHSTFNAATMFFADINGSKSNRFENWQQTATNPDANGLWVNPDFVIPGTDFTPQLPLLANSGTSLGLNEDVFKQARDVAAPSIGAIEFSAPAGVDPLIEGIDLDSIVCSGLYPISLLVNNYGGDNVDSLLIQMIKNGITTTHMVTQTLLPGVSTSITVDSVVLTSSDALDLEFTILESFPGPDIDTSNNDYAIIGVRTRMSGTYTVNRFQPNSGTNFNSHEEAVYALNTYGVCGPVIIETAPFTGPYNEFLHLKRVTGADSINTITFDGSNVRVNPTSDFKNNTALWQIERGEYVTVKNFDFQVTGTPQDLDNCDILLVTNRSKSIRILNNSFQFPNDASSTTHINIVGDKFIDNFLPINDTIVVSGNHLVGGGRGIEMHSTEASRINHADILKNYIISNVDNINVSSINHLNCSENIVTINTGYAISIKDAFQLNLERNGIFFDDLGDIRTRNIHAGIKTESAAGNIYLANNVISTIADNAFNSSPTFGVDLDVTTSANVNISHNTIYIRSEIIGVNPPKTAVAVRASNCQSLLSKNNIFYLTSPPIYANFYNIDNTAQSCDIDHNVYYSLFDDEKNVRMLESPALNINSFENWQISYGEANGLFTSPLFFDINAQDFYPLSERITQTATVLTPAVDVDYFDTIRKTPADPGAIEFEPAPCPGLLSQNASFTDTLLVFEWRGTTKEVDIIYGPSGFDTATDGTTVLNLTDEIYTTGTWQNGECYDYYVRQHCHTGGTSGWEGPVTACVPHNVDLGVIITSPNPMCHPQFGDLMMGIDVYNAGLNSVNSFTITYRTQGIAFVDDSLVVNSIINPGDTASFSIPVPGNNTEEGGRLIFNVDLRVPDDGNRDNDVKGQSYYIIPFEPFPQHVAVCPNSTDPVTLYAKRFPGVGHVWFDVDTNVYNMNLHEGDTFVTNAMPGDTFYLAYFYYPTGYPFMSSFIFEEYFVLNPNSAVSSSEYNPDLQKDAFESACYYPVTINHDPYLLLRKSLTKASVETRNNAAPKDALFRVRKDEEWSETLSFSDTRTNRLSGNREYVFEIDNPVFNSTGDVDFAMHLGRYSDGLGCGVNLVRINPNQWDVLVEYQYISCSLTKTPIIIEETPLPEAGFDFAENAMRGFFLATGDNVDSSYFRVVTLGLGGKPGKRVEFDFPAVGNYLVCQYVYNECGADTICEWIEIKNVQVSVDNETLSDLITLFPNPSSGDLTMRAEGVAYAKTDIFITDAYGNKITALEWDAPLDGTREKTWSLQHLAAGAYLIEIRQGDARVVKRWIKL